MFEGADVFAGRADSPGTGAFSRLQSRPVAISSARCRATACRVSLVQTVRELVRVTEISGVVRWMAAMRVHAAARPRMAQGWPDQRTRKKASPSKAVGRGSLACRQAARRSGGGDANGMRARRVSQASGMSESEREGGVFMGFLSRVSGSLRKGDAGGRAVCLFHTGSGWRRCSAGCRAVGRSPRRSAPPTA